MVETVGATKVFILAGVNNISRGNYDKTIAREYEQLLAELLEMNVEIYIQTIMPVRDPSKVSNGRIRKANEIIVELANNYGCHIIDTYSFMVDENGELKEEYSRDGIHLTSDGYEQWYANLQEYFE
jgi:lysophospholipase L1-like esterase